MFSFLASLFRKRPKPSANPNRMLQPPGPENVHTELARNIQYVKEQFTQTPDLVVRHVHGDTPAALVYLDSLADKNSINNDVVLPLIRETSYPPDKPPVAMGDVRKTSDWSAVEHAVYHGKSVLFVEGSNKAYILGTQGWPQRAIEDPQLEASLKGAHQGFVETGSQNIALIRRYIPHNELKIKQFYVSSRGNCKVSVMYLRDVADPAVLEKLEQRIKKLKIDNIINTGELSEFIEDNAFSPFPQFILTERPDTAASHVMQGRYAVVVDRSPSVLIGPVSFISFFQSVDDYSMRWISASFIRLLRFFAAFIALFLPAVYIAFISFHYEVIPIQLLLSIAESRARVPFHPFLEALIMEITLELMREAGIRLPAPIGQTVGLVGGIIIGETAVQTGIVSNIMVIVVASTAIASFVIPNHDMGAAIRLLRFPMMLMAFMFGIVGIVIGAMIMLGHLLSLQSLGTAYGSPFGPVRFTDWKDTLLRFPLWTMIKRPTAPRPKQENRLEEQDPTGGQL